MNIVIITNLSRPDLFLQTVLSLRDNAANWESHHLTVVVDGPQRLTPVSSPADVLIRTRDSVGASAARNIGASSIPNYRRHDAVCFFDDDIYAVKDWDVRLWQLLRTGMIASGHAHPFNGSEERMMADSFLFFREPLVISTVNMAMTWDAWDECGPFQEPGGSGGSEDYALCMVAKENGYGFGVTSPECILHTGQHSSSGKPIVGYSEVCAHNAELIEIHGLQGKVIFG